MDINTCIVIVLLAGAGVRCGSAVVVQPMSFDRLIRIYVHYKSKMYFDRASVHHHAFALTWQYPTTATVTHERMWKMIESLNSTYTAFLWATQQLCDVHGYDQWDEAMAALCALDGHHTSLVCDRGVEADQMYGNGNYVCLVLDVQDNRHIDVFDYSYGCSED